MALDFMDIMNSGIFSGQEACVFSFFREQQPEESKPFHLHTHVHSVNLHNSLFTRVVHPKIKIMSSFNPIKYHI